MSCIATGCCKLTCFDWAVLLLATLAVMYPELPLLCKVLLVNPIQLDPLSWRPPSPENIFFMLNLNIFQLIRSFQWKMFLWNKKKIVHFSGWLSGYKTYSTCLKFEKKIAQIYWTVIQLLLPTKRFLSLIWQPSQFLPKFWFRNLEYDP